MAPKVTQISTSWIITIAIQLVKSHKEYAGDGGGGGAIYISTHDNVQLRKYSRRKDNCNMYSYHQGRADDSHSSLPARSIGTMVNSGKTCIVVYTHSRQYKPWEGLTLTLPPVLHKTVFHVDHFC